MKKIFYFIIVTAVLICSVFLSGCQTTLEKYSDYISELRENVYVYSDDEIDVIAMTGLREEVFVLDGHCGGTCYYTLITIDPIEQNDYSYTAVINEIEYAGELVAHPFASTYSVDIEVLCEMDAIELTIYSDNYSCQCTLESVKTDDMIDAEKAIEIAEKNLSSQVNSLKVNGELNAEIYVRLMNNPIDNSGGYYWYVAFIGNQNSVYAVLVDPITMEVVAIRD